MTNADILMGAIVFLTCVFFVWPCVIDMLGANMGYKDAVLSGVFLTLAVVILLGVALAILTAVAYFSNSLNPDSPAQGFVEWVNSL